jgi:hypothetical protein
MVKAFYRRLLPFFALSLLLTQVGRAQPIILSQPLSVLNLLLGNSVTFSATAISPITTNLVYQWLKNGVPIPGETNSSLTIDSVQGTNCGSFSVEVDDSVAVAVSTPADLTVNILELLGKDLLLVVGLTGEVRGNSVGAGKQAGEPQIIPNDPGGNSIWFKWTPLLGGIVTFTTAGSDFDTIMGVYTGTAPNGLVQVPSAINDDDGGGYLGSQITFNAQALTTYIIGVDGYYGSAGNVMLSWNEELSLDSLPSVTKPLPAALTVSNGATVSLPSPWGKACDWYLNGQFLRGPIATLTITNCGATNLGAYVAEISTSDGHTSISQPLQLQMNALEDGTTATNSFALNKFLNSANSDFTPPTQQQGQIKTKAAQKMDSGGDTGGYSVSQTFNTTSDTEEPGEPSIAGQVGGHPGWYSFVTPVRGQLLITTAGSAFNTELGVFVGPGNSFSTLTNIGCGYTTNYQANGQPVLTIPQVPANQTNYIVVDGEKGASGTVQLHISVANAVTVLTPPQNQAVAAGTTATFNLGATGDAPLTYYWKFNGTVIPGATNSILTINNAQASAVGTYTGYVTNSVSAASSSAALSIVTPPSITNQPSSQAVPIATNVTFSCAAAGSTPLVYQWQFANKIIAQTTNTFLVLNNVQATNTGSYICVVTNIAGVVTSSVAVLSVQGLPTIFSQPDSQTVAAGSTATLSVTVGGPPVPTLQWYWNGTPTGANSSQLIIPNFQAANQGTYSVVASNFLGIATSTPFLLMLSGNQFNTYIVTNGNFQLQLAGTAGSNYVIQSSTDLVHWTSLLTNVTRNGFVNFIDTNSLAPRCFYRSVSQ